MTSRLRSWPNGLIPIVSCLGVFLVIPGVRLCGQQETPREVPVVPGPQYQAGGLHRFLFGERYRDLWASELEIPVLDLESFAGGLTPVRPGGGGQTRSLRLAGADGREYVFRSVDKNPTRSLPEYYHGTVVEWLARDLVSGLHPGAALVSAPLLGAVGLLHADPRMVVMPDSPLLGEHRAEFAGMLGLIEVRPNEPDAGGIGFASSERIVGTERFLEYIDTSPRHRVNARAFLKARIVDLYLGDRDRHPDNWRWARFAAPWGFRWEPIPRDRDQAFLKQGGLFVWLAGINAPDYVSFGPEYSSVEKLVWRSSDLDRRLLAELERPVFDSVAAEIEVSLTDSVIEEAVRSLPATLYRKNGAELREVLRSRRDGLRSAAGEFYRILAEYVDVSGTAESDRAEIIREDAGTVMLRLSYLQGGTSRTYLTRRFRPDETAEIRVHLGEGSDRAQVSGDARSPIVVRVIGGGGLDLLVDSSSVPGTHFYDAPGDAVIEKGRHTRVETEEFQRPAAGTDFHQYAPDWGGQWLWFPVVQRVPDVGLFAGLSATYRAYGFRQYPYRYRFRVNAAYATSVSEPLVRLAADLPALAKGLRPSLELEWSGLEVINFFGFGNGSVDTASSDFNRVAMERLEFVPSLEWSPSDRVRVNLGLALDLNSTDTTGGNRGTLISEEVPFGMFDFLSLGLLTEVEWDTRDLQAFPSRGMHLVVRGHVEPNILDVTEGSYGGVHAVGSGYLSNDGFLQPTLALRLAGERVWGRFPYFDAAFLGGGETVRGFSEDRFAGEASVYGNASLRLFVSRFSILMPGEFGVFGAFDAGRVFFDGEVAPDSDRLHTAGGGGIWFSFLSREHTFSVAVMRSRERTGVYFRSGFLF